MPPPRITPRRSKRVASTLPIETCTTLHSFARYYEVTQTEVMRQLVARKRASLISQERASRPMQAVLLPRRLQGCPEDET